MYAVSPIPLWRRYASAFLAMWRGSREYGCLVIGSKMEFVRLSVGIA